MANLTLLIASAALTAICGVWAFRAHSAGAKTLFARMTFIASYGLTLLLALRFGARAYPGVWFAESAFLNEIFNGSTLFILGYLLTLVAVVADGSKTLLGAGRTPQLSQALTTFTWIGAGGALLIVAYGFLFASLLGRLPG